MITPFRLLNFYTRDSADLAMADQSRSGDVAAGIIGRIVKGEGYGTIAPPPLNKDASGWLINS